MSAEEGKAGAGTRGSIWVGVRLSKLFQSVTIWIEGPYIGRMAHLQANIRCLRRTNERFNHARTGEYFLSNPLVTFYPFEACV